MDRQLLLKHLIDTKFSGKQADFARAIGRAPAQVHQWVAGHRRLGGAGARHIETTLGLSPGYFDRDLTYAEIGLLNAPTAAEPSLEADIAEVAALLAHTDARGRSMAIGALRAILSVYAPRKPEEL